MSGFESLIAALNQANVRYVVVGGVATVLHGFARLTADIDLIVDLSDDEALRAVRALTALGLQPRAPVNADEFAKPETRRQWIEEKGMQVFSMFDPTDPFREVDVFTESPIEFEDLWERSVVMELATTSVRVASIPDLIALKRLAGRTQDLQDIEALEALLDASRKEQ